MYVAMYESTFVRSLVRTELCSIRYVANGTSVSICRRESAEYHRLHIYISSYIHILRTFKGTSTSVHTFIHVLYFISYLRTKVLSYSEVVVHRVTSGSTTIIQYVVATYESKVPSKVRRYVRSHTYSRLTCFFPEIKNKIFCTHVLRATVHVYSSTKVLSYVVVFYLRTIDSERCTYTYTYSTR